MTLYKALKDTKIWKTVNLTIYRDMLSAGREVNVLWSKKGDGGNAGYIESPSTGFVNMLDMRVSDTQPAPTTEHPPFSESLITPDLRPALDVSLVQEVASKIEGFPIPLGTYANILLRPVPRRGIKDSPIRLTGQEVRMVQMMNGMSMAKWNWICGQEHTRYIYMSDEKGQVSITSISAYYSNQNAWVNRFRVLEETGGWVKVQTYAAGSNWYDQPLQPWAVHRVWSMNRGGSVIDNPCGWVWLPIITRSGYGWMEKDQLG